MEDKLTEFEEKKTALFDKPTVLELLNSGSYSAFGMSSVYFSEAPVVYRWGKITNVYFGVFFLALFIVLQGIHIYKKHQSEK